MWASDLHTCVRAKQRMAFVWLFNLQNFVKLWAEREQAENKNSANIWELQIIRSRVAK